MKLKKTLTIISQILLVFSFLLILSCAKNEDEEKRADSQRGGVAIKSKSTEWKRFEDFYLGFHFDYPGNWEVDLDDVHRFAVTQDKKIYVAAEGGVVEPIDDVNREKANQSVFNQTLEDIPIKGIKKSKVSAGLASAFLAVGELNDGRLAWVKVTTYGDVRYRIRVLYKKEFKAQYEGLASRIIESFKITDEVRIAGSPFGRDVVVRSVRNPSIPPSLQVQQNKFGFSFAHPQGWEIKQRSRENGYDYKGAGISLSCLAAANYVKEPWGMQLRKSLRQAFNSQVPSGSKLREKAVLRNFGIVKGMSGYGNLTNGKGQYWLAVAVQRDLSYNLYLQCTLDCDSVSKIANKIIESFQVTEELTHSDFMKRIMDRTLPWDEPSFKAKRHSQEAQKLWKQGKYDEAIAEFRQSVKLDPNVAGYHSYLAYSLDARGQLESAVKHWREAIALEPKSGSYHRGLGLTLYKKGKLERAIVELRKATELESSARNHGTLGAFLYEKGDFENAIKEYSKTIQLDPNDALAHFYLGVSLGKKGMPSESIKALRNACKLDLDPQLRDWIENTLHIECSAKP